MKNKKAQKEQKKSGKFYPFPSGKEKVIFFATPETDGFEYIHNTITRSKAKKKLLPRDYMERSVVNMDWRLLGERKEATVKLGKISRCFASGSYVSLRSLKAEKLVADDVNYVIIKGKGKLKKALAIEANEFKPAAVRMIVLAGGRPILLK